MLKYCFFKFPHRHCLAYVYGSLLKRVLQEFKERWNSHRIRPSRIAGCPAGVPDDLYYLPHLNGLMQHDYVQYTVYYFILGTVSYKQSLNFVVWSHCYLEYAYNAPPFYPDEFAAAADAILAELSTSKEAITVTTAKAVYSHLCSRMT